MISRARKLRWGSLLLVLALALSACGGGDGTGAEGQGQSISVTLGAGHPAGGAITYTNLSQDLFVPEFVKRVEEETDHTIQVNEAYGGSITPLGEVLEGTRDGILDIGLVPWPFEPSNLFLHNIAYYVPFGTPDPTMAIQVVRDAFEEHPEMITVFEEEWNQKMLGIAGVGNYGLISTFEWSDVSELRGKKISAAGPNLPWLEPVGAVPVQGNLNEWYTSLQTGVFEGAIMFPEATVGFRLHEPAPNYTKTDFGAIGVGSLNVNLDFFNGLPEEVQEILVELGREYEEQMGPQIDEDAEAAIQTMEEEGTAIRELPFDQKQAWADALPNIPAERAAEADEMGLPGTDLMRTYLQLMKDAGFEFPRDWEV